VSFIPLIKRLYKVLDDSPDSALQLHLTSMQEFRRRGLRLDDLDEPAFPGEKEAKTTDHDLTHKPAFSPSLQRRLNGR
jgi:hypothetical protein